MFEKFCVDVCRYFIAADDLFEELQLSSLACPSVCNRGRSFSGFATSGLLLLALICPLGRGVSGPSASLHLEFSFPLVRDEDAAAPCPRAFAW